MCIVLDERLHATYPARTLALNDMLFKPIFRVDMRALRMIRLRKVLYNRTGNSIRVPTEPHPSSIVAVQTSNPTVTPRSFNGATQLPGNLEPVNLQVSLPALILFFLASR